MRLYHNMASVDVYRRYKDSLVDQSKALGRISSGLKVQNYKDNPNAMAKGKKLELQVRGLQMASRNLQDGMSLLQVADGGMQNIEDSLQRIRELTVQAGGINNDSDKNAIKIEIDELLKHIDDTANRTGMNGINLLASGNAGKSIKLLAGSYAQDVLELPLCDLTSAGLGIDGGKINISTNADIDSSLGYIDKAIDDINRYRSKHGGIASRLDSIYNYTSKISLKSETAMATTVGADIALEMMELSKSSLLVNTGFSIMSQTNKIPQDVLRILENIRTY
ncbi:flagellin [Clostridium punense]|uniref:Flagellin n=1 Tax=Clostridium punense TaxID=1054297 RepID=A0ABS4K3I3_9CLOT|nr:MULTISPECIES: flagellin [Clostridium]EQB87762.1 hypothetical protein M918_07310 [Clostridium sp. BL8]MBP2021810.1 flagellin [Clostridium punense]